ncbi:CPBP family intramembrane glutamic endopeptidase [Dactylosporangium sp. NPDC049140]|uniref:CPBP family intramembrane glutamic endopeptidase n=1 Tax=Dactylosporangium sp. NPDC049140 TaxID=3155647 RepID=UPI00340EB143
MRFILRFPLMLIAAFALLAVTEGVTAARSDDPTWAVSAGFTSAVVAVVGYAWLSRWIERRPAAPEVSPSNAARWLLPGLLLGAAAFGLVMLGIRLLGGWDTQTRGSFEGLAVTAGIMACVAANEEILFRGVIARMIAERFGGWAALIVSSLLFGAMHLINANATVQAALAITLTGGLLFGVLYLATRSLWLTIGFHFAWNTVQAGVFGVSSSGEDAAHSLYRTTLTGADWLTGGTFGPEASVVTLVVITVPALILLAFTARTARLRRAPAVAVDRA